MACAQFSTSEAQVTQMKSRLMLYACANCIDMIKAKSKVIPSSTSIETSINDLEKQIQSSLEMVGDRLLKKMSQKFELMNTSVQNKIIELDNEKPTVKIYQKMEEFAKTITSFKSNMDKLQNTSDTQKSNSNLQPSELSDELSSELRSCHATAKNGRRSWTNQRKLR